MKIKILITLINNKLKKNKDVLKSLQNLEFQTPDISNQKNRENVDLF